MPLQSHMTNEEEKIQICDWKYQGEYACYNLESYETYKKQGIFFANPKNQQCYTSYYDEALLVGFTNILEEEHEVFIGIGVNPHVCNKGYGTQILKMAYEISKQLYPTKPLYLEVRTWNERAIHCYEKVGFVKEKEIKQETPMEEGIFWRMTKP